MKNNINIEKIKFIKLLGKGLYGSTYKISYMDFLYALKRQKILKSYITGDTKYPLWREFKFLKWISKLSKNDQCFFMKLVAYRFYSDCDFSNKTENHQNKLIQKLNKSNHCVDMIFDLKSGIVSDIIPYIDLKQSMSLCVQILYAINLMRKSLYIHTDLHSNNIAYIKIKKNDVIKIKTDKLMKFKSYGYQFSIIDYGLVLYSHFKLSKKEQKKYELNYKFNKDFSMFFIYCLTQTKYCIKKKSQCKYQIFADLSSKPFLYSRIKNQILSIYPDMIIYYKEYETKGKINRFLLYEVVQFMAIYDKRSLTNICSVKYRKNLLPDDILEYIKLNIHKSNDKVIKNLIMNYLN